MIEAGDDWISVRRQRELIGLSRASLYYEPAEESAENLLLMRLLNKQYTR
jgi:putative transposase